MTGLRRRLTVLVCAVALPLMQASLASAQDDQTEAINPDRPGIADGSRVLGAVGVELEVGIQTERDVADQSTTHALFIPTLVRIGLGKRLEGRIETNNYTWTSTADGAAPDVHQNGFSPASVGFKYGLFDSGGSPRHSAGVIVRVFPATGTGDLATHHTTADIRLAADWDLSEKWSLNPNAGLARYESDSGRPFSAGLLALTLNYTPTDALNPFIDAGYQKPSQPGRPGMLIVDSGIAWIIGKNVQIDVSGGVGSFPGGPRPFVSAGLSVRRLKHSSHPM